MARTTKTASRTVTKKTPAVRRSRQTAEFNSFIKDVVCGRVRKSLSDIKSICAVGKDAEMLGISQWAVLDRIVTDVYKQPGSRECYFLDTYYRTEGLRQAPWTLTGVTRMTQRRQFIRELCESLCGDDEKDTTTYYLIFMHIVLMLDETSRVAKK